jgi:tetratricopeptide (TPR) repeat protein
LTDTRKQSRVRALPIFRPSRNSYCLCGSGEKFKRCCADKLPGGRIGHKRRLAIDKGEYDKALAECRADVTQYTIWHKSHTEPLLRIVPEQGRTLLDVDIDALGDLVEVLRWCYIKCERAIEFPAVLERLRENINDVRWQRKIIYFQAVHSLWPDWIKANGRRELSKLGSMREETDVQILQLYLDLFGEDLTFSQGQDVIERIVELAERDVDRLHYRGVRALQYLTIGDKLKAEEELDAAISAFRASVDVTNLTPYEKDLLAMSLETLGELRRDVRLVDESIELYQELIKLGDYWTPAGRSHLLRFLGDAYRHKSAWGEARDAYAEAVREVGSSVASVFLAQCLLHLDGWKEAANAISKAKPQELSSGEYYDYVVAVAVIAIESEDRKRLLAAQRLLRDLKAPEPYFREQRDSLLLDVIETEQSGKSKTIVRRAMRALGGIAGTASRYLKLEPNFMGLGVNVGKMLEDISSRTKHKEPE